MNTDELVNGLKQCFENKLVSALFFGSDANKIDDKEASHNLLVVLNETSPNTLARATKLLNKWYDTGHTAALFFTPEHFETSLDVFPLEFLDIKDRHHLLIGENPLKDKIIKRDNLRHQCETELRGKLLHLRSYYALNSSKDKSIGLGLLETLPTFLSVFRGIIHLCNEKPAWENEIVLEQLEKHINFNPQCFFDLMNMWEKKSRLPKGDDLSVLYEHYLTELGTITKFVDQL